MTQKEKEKARVRAREWYEKYPERAKWSQEIGYINYRDKRLEHMREYAKQNPHINQESVRKWREANPDRDPAEYRLKKALRESCLLLWGNECGMCGRTFEAKGGLRSIFHHLDYAPMERVVCVCYQCHNLIHGRKAYWHPFLKLGGEQMPTILHRAMEKLDDRVIEIDRPHPHSVNTINTRAKYRLVKKSLMEEYND